MKRYSKNQLQRYPIYLKYLRQLKEQGYTSVSSPLIAKELGYSEEQIRKDLQLVSNEAGRPKKGRSIDKLIETLDIAPRQTLSLLEPAILETPL